jgi:hypothetical protein
MNSAPAREGPLVGSGVLRLRSFVMLAAMRLASSRESSFAFGEQALRVFRALLMQKTVASETPINEPGQRTGQQMTVGAFCALPGVRQRPRGITHRPRLGRHSIT